MEKQSDYISTYRQVKVNTANPARIIVMLYDELVKQIDVAIRQIDENGGLDVVNNAILKAHDIVTELMASLDMEKGGEIAKQLHDLYTFFCARLIQGNIKKDPEILRNTRALITELRASWKQISHTPSPQTADRLPTIDIHG